MDEARAALAGISVSGEASNYDAALATASQAFADPGRIDTAQNVSYFFSDGEPTIDSSGHPFNYTGQFDPFLGDGIDQGEELAWQAFLAPAPDRLAGDRCRPARRHLSRPAQPDRLERPPPAAT